MWRCLASSWIFKIRGQAEVRARDLNLGVTKMGTAFQARSLEGLSACVSVDREKRRSKDRSYFSVERNEKICTEETEKEHPT